MAAFMAARNVGDPEIVKARELVEASFANGASPAATTRRVMALMLAHASEQAGEEGQEFSIPKRSLRQAHKSNERLQDILDEIQRTLLRIRWAFRDDATGEATTGTATVNLLSYRFDEDGEEQSIRYAFSPVAAFVMRRSSVYAALNRAAILSFESRYTITLYELGCLLVRREHPVWEGTIDELRALIGVPSGAYEDFANLRRKTLDQAAAELEQLAPFRLIVTPIRTSGRRIGRVRLTFEAKGEEEVMAARRELEASKVGRRARREGTVEKVAEAPSQLTPDVQQALMRLKAGLPTCRNDMPEQPEPGAVLDDISWQAVARQFSERARQVQGIETFPTRQRQPRKT